MLSGPWVWRAPSFLRAVAVLVPPSGGLEGLGWEALPGGYSWETGLPRGTLPLAPPGPASPGALGKPVQGL